MWTFSPLYVPEIPIWDICLKISRSDTVTYPGRPTWAAITRLYLTLLLMILIKISSACLVRQGPSCLHHPRGDARSFSVSWCGTCSSLCRIFRQLNDPSIKVVYCVDPAQGSGRTYKNIKELVENSQQTRQLSLTYSQPQDRIICWRTPELLTRTSGKNFPSKLEHFSVVRSWRFFAWVQQFWSDTFKNEAIGKLELRTCFWNYRIVKYRHFPSLRLILRIVQDRDLGKKERHAEGIILNVGSHENHLFNNINEHLCRTDLNTWYIFIALSYCCVYTIHS